MAGCQAVFRAETTSELEDERLGQLCVVAPWPDVTKLRPELLKLNAHIASWTRSGVVGSINGLLSQRGGQRRRKTNSGKEEAFVVHSQRDKM